MIFHYALNNRPPETQFVHWNKAQRRNFIINAFRVVISKLSWSPRETLLFIRQGDWRCWHNRILEWRTGECRLSPSFVHFTHFTYKRINVARSKWNKQNIAHIRYWSAAKINGFSHCTLAAFTRSFSKVNSLSSLLRAFDGLQRLFNYCSRGFFALWICNVKIKEASLKARSIQASKNRRDASYISCCLTSWRPLVCTITFLN